jgi:hypothetical protein
MSYVQIGNTLVSLFLCGCLTYIVLCARIREGFWFRLGLTATAAGLFITALLTIAESRDWPAYHWAGVLTRTGMLIAVLTYLIRSRFGRRRVDLVTAPGELDAPLDRVFDEPRIGP